LDKSTKKNGSTRLIPKSHKKLGWPDKHINIYKKNKYEIRPAIKAGSIIVVNLNLWHAGSKNILGKKRRMIMLNIKRRNLPQLLNYKKFLNKNTRHKLNEVQKYLLAIRNSDKTQKEDSVGVGKYYKKDFYSKKKKI
jgi:ectoine hydroxylase-related dioxygenase (phytanoyl-CoA dioxygenase family)